MLSSRHLVLATYVAGIYVCYIVWAILQERVSAIDWCSGEGEKRVCERYTYVFVLNGIQAFIACIVALVSLAISGQGFPWPGPLLLDYVKVAVSHTIASPFGYASLKHINYPTHVLAKSCKLIPVMLTGTIIYRRSFTWSKYVSVLLITAGVSWFTLAKGSKKEDKANSLYGLLLVFINLVLDGFTNSTQDEIFRKAVALNGGKKLSPFHMMFNLNLMGTLLMVAYLMSPLTSELADATAFLARHPGIFQDILLFCVCGAVGQVFVYLTLEHFGSLVLVSVTVTRKLFTIFLSCIFYNHPLNVQQYFAVATVFAGISIEEVVKIQEKNAKKQKEGAAEKVGDGDAKKVK